MMPNITNTHLTRLSLKEHENSKTKIDASCVNKKEDFLRMIGLQRSVVHREIDYLLTNIHIPPCSVVIAGVKCQTCNKCFKCITDLDLHVKRYHKNVISKNTYDDTAHNCYQVPYDFVKTNEKFSTKKSNLRLVLKIGNEILSKVDLKRKYLEMNIHVPSKNKRCYEQMKDQRSKKELVFTKYVDQNQLTASQAAVLDNLNEKSKWLTALQNGASPTGKENSANGIADARMQQNGVIVADSEVSIFHQEMANIIKQLDDRIKKCTTPEKRKIDTADMKKAQTPVSDITEIYLSDDDDIVEIVEIKKAGRNAKTMSANSTDHFANENVPPQRKKEKFYQEMKTVSEINMKDIMDNAKDYVKSQNDETIRHFQENIRMADALEEMRKMEEKGFYLREQQSCRKPYVQKIVDLT